MNLTLSVAQLEDKFSQKNVIIHSTHVYIKPYIHANVYTL